MYYTINLIVILMHSCKWELLSGNGQKRVHKVCLRRILHMSYVHCGLGITIISTYTSHIVCMVNLTLAYHMDTV